MCSSILDILSRYDIDVIDIKESGDDYLIKSKQGVKLLKRVKHGKRRIRKGFYISRYLLGMGFENTVRYVTSRSGKPYVKFKNSYFYMTDFIEGRNVELSSLVDIKKLVQTLAKFHNAAKGREGYNFFKVDKNLKNSADIFKSRCSDLLRYRRLIDSKKLRCEFDIKYRDNIDYQYSQGLIAMELLNKANYCNLFKYAKEERSICYNSFASGSFMVDENQDIYLLDHSSIVRGMRIYDLAKLIRKILYNSECAFNFDIAKEIIDIYSIESQLSEQEIKVLLAIIMFPNKYWRLGHRRYDKHKLWREDKYIEKLDTITEQTNRQKIFIEEFASYYSVKIT